MKKTTTPSTFFRLLKYLLKSFPLQYVLIISTLLVSSAASIPNTVFSSILIYTIISPFQDGSILKIEHFVEEKRRIIKCFIKRFLSLKKK